MEAATVVDTAVKKPVTGTGTAGFAKIL